ncbi:peptidoglycan DD-metalloendopeptidase family protein [Candidatus Dojkabacteria bacterium]|nr:peptidoglycan DD-metalloendopeptidase family protein [Candidatus Dojkabacteria bacterium]
MKPSRKDSKIFGTQGFKQLVLEMEQKRKFDIAEDPDSPEDTGYAKFDDFELDDKSVFSSKLADFLKQFLKGGSPIAFLVSFFVYISVRMRVIYILISVFAEVFSSSFDSIKRFIVRNLFWGRGNLFKHSVQVISVLLLSGLLIFGRYRVNVINTVEAYSIYEVSGEYSDQAVNRDLFVQNASTNTQIPDDRGRIGVVEYVVKGGDTINQIANFFGVSEETMRWANDLSEVSVIHPGDVLKIPPGDGVIREVQKGDTLEKFAERYKRDDQTVQAVMQSIADSNWLDPPFDLEEGQELFVPEGRLPITEDNAVSYSGVVKYSRGSGDVGRFLSWPVEGGRGGVTQCFHSWHNGVDIADGGSPDLVAAASGVVTFAGCHSGHCPSKGSLYGGSGTGWGVEVDHGNGFVTVYGHMRSIYVKKGQKVKRGQALGKMGASGTATGIHIHFMVWKNGRWNTVNPASYMTRKVCGQ